MINFENILLIDGAMGTSIQNLNLSSADFGGDHLDGCNEYLNIINPTYIKDIHRSFIDVGANIIETNTFGATPIVLDEYNLSNLAEEINFKAANIAKSSINDSDKSIFVAGSMGPTTKLLSLNQIKSSEITFDLLVDNYRIQARGLISGGSDFLLIETSQDILNVKAAIKGIALAKSDLNRNDIPFAVQCTIENMGTTLGGQDIESFYLTIKHNDLLWIGMNCATGPKFMREHLRLLSQISSHPISIVPNAGLPDEHGNYNESPSEFSKTIEEYIKNGWVNVIGGCCGTVPDHISKLKKLTQNHNTVYDNNKNKSNLKHFVTGLESLYVDESTKPILVGERTNVLGSKRFKRLIENNDFDQASEIGKLQINSGANVIDVCLQNPDRDEIDDITKFLEMLTSKIKAPIMIDSTDIEVIKEAIKLCPGKIIINSVNLEDGEEKFKEIAPIIKSFGASVIVGCIDEDKDQAQAITRKRKLEIAERSFDLLTNDYELNPNDIIFDPLTFPIGTGDINYLDSAEETIEGIKLIKKELPIAKMILGISNVSFGLPTNGREVLNSVMLNHCLNAGLDYAIVNTQNLKRFNSLSNEEISLSNELIFNNSKKALDKFVEYFRSTPVNKTVKENIPWDKFLKESVINGSKNKLEPNLDKGLKKYSPLDIINGPLMKGMDVVSDLFGKNELIVAEVLQSAEVMKSSVSYLEQYMEKADITSKGTIMLATVKGDVHDIGKNLVDIILTNNGYKVINLGIKVNSQELIDAYKQYNPDYIGLSGLLVKSAQMMVDTVSDLTNEKIDIPILVGGAALTEKFTYLNIFPNYNNLVIYAKDAMSGLDIVNDLNNAKGKEKLVIDVDKKIKHFKSNMIPRKSKIITDKPVSVKNPIKQLDVIPQPPDLKIHNIVLPIEDVWNLINPTMLYNRHLGYKGNFTNDLKMNVKKAVDLLKSVNKVKEILKDNQNIQAKGVYKFFKSKSDKNDLIIYDSNSANEISRFTFGRQTDKDMLSLSDYVYPVTTDKDDYICMFVTTYGPHIREIAEEYQNKGEFLISHIIQSLALETAEASAEYIHQKIREMWGIKDSFDITNQDIFKAKYTGKRYSFGYPACPRLEDQKILWDLLNPDKNINVELTEEYMMDPEGSVSAIVFHHPDAKYFNLDNDAIEKLNFEINK